MGGLGVLFCIGLYLFIAFKVIGAFKTSRYQWLVIALVVLIPSGDAVVGRWYLQHLCAKEGGLKVYRVVEHVEGFMDDDAVTEYWAKQLGYKFIEGASSSDSYFRYTRMNGNFIREDNVLPKSKHRVRSYTIGQHDIYTRYISVVEEVEKGDVLAKYSLIGFNGGWAERFLAQFSDAGGGGVAWCENVPKYPEIRHGELISNTLKH